MPDRPLLQSLAVENLLLLEQARIALEPGLNVITGETGAGKTMLARALDLLLGARAPKSAVRPGAKEAYIEGVFSVPAGWLERLDGSGLEDIIDLGADEITLARRISAQGKSRCLISGRSAPLDLLRDTAAQLIAFYGQHEQQRIAVESVQSELLAASAPGGHEILAAFRAARAAAAQAARRLQELQAAQAARGREADLAAHELAELGDAAVADGEEPALMEELRRLGHAHGGKAACQLACDAAGGGHDGEPGAAQLAAQAAEALAGAGAGEADELARRLQACADELNDIAADAGALGAGWEPDPAREQEITVRLALIHRLVAKHRVPSAADLPAVHERLAAQAAAADELPAQVKAAQAASEAADGQLQAAAGKLTAWRRKAAPKLAKAMTASLQDLAMSGSVFEVRLPAEAGGCGPQGAERVQFAFQANPGMPAGTLAEAASGGELSRIMLALAGACPSADGGVMVLDEPDAGIGGETAHGVARRLRELAAGRQVLAISHLPQIASRADAHFVLEKSDDGKTTRATITPLDGEAQRVAELCRMGGHSPQDHDASSAARRLLAGA